MCMPGILDGVSSARQAKLGLYYENYLLIMYSALILKIYYKMTRYIAIVTNQVL